MAVITPNLIIVGAPKCGTTSVFDWLSEHPEVCASSVKETYFLMDKGYPLFRPEKNYHKDGINGYKSFFSGCDENSKIFLEATPDYLYQKTALDVIGGLSSFPLVLCIFRKPSDRVYSLFQFARNNVSVIDKKVSFKSFVHAVMGEDKYGIVRDRPILKKAIHHSQYVDYLDPWINSMGGNVKVELFENMRADPKLFMMDLANYFNIDEKFFEAYDFSAKNKTYEIKSQRAHLIKKRLSKVLPAGEYRRALRKFYKKINTGQSSEKTIEDIEMLRILDEHFEGSNQRLESLTGLDLSVWRK